LSPIIFIHSHSNSSWLSVFLHIDVFSYFGLTFYFDYYLLMNLQSFELVVALFVAIFAMEMKFPKADPFTRRPIWTHSYLFLSQILNPEKKLNHDKAISIIVAITRSTMQHLQSFYFVQFFILFFSSSALGVTLVSMCYCPNATEFQNPDPGYFSLRQTARKLCRTQQLNAATIYRVPGKIKKYPHKIMYCSICLEL